MLNATASDFYYWYQYGSSAGLLSDLVRRVRTSDLMQIDLSSASVPSFNRNPLDCSPVSLDETRNLIFSKNKVFDATNLTKVVYSLPLAFDTFNGAAENAYALDSLRGLLATKNTSTSSRATISKAPTLVPGADHVLRREWCALVPFDSRGCARSAGRGPLTRCDSARLFQGLLGWRRGPYTKSYPRHTALRAISLILGHAMS